MGRDIFFLPYPFPQCHRLNIQVSGRVLQANIAILYSFTHYALSKLSKNIKNLLYFSTLIYDFQVTQDTIPVIQITFKKNLDNSTFQTLSYQLPEDFDPVTITDGVEVIDMNKDGIDDFLFDLGVYGKISKKVCLVYNNEAQQYIFIDDFEELNSPAFLKEYGYFVTAPIPMDLPMTYDRYLLDGTILHHVGRLSISQSESNTLYTEYEQVNGEWITTKDMVNENDVELTKWGLSSEQW